MNPPLPLPNKTRAREHFKAILANPSPEGLADAAKLFEAYCAVTGWPKPDHRPIEVIVARNSDHDYKTRSFHTLGDDGVATAWSYIRAVKAVWTK